MLLFVQPSGNTLHGGPIYACGGVNGTMKKYIWKQHCEDWNSCSHSTKWSREKHSLYSKSIVNGIKLFFTIIDYPKKPCLDSLYSTKKILSMSSPQQRRKPHWSNRITWAKEEGHVIIMFSIFFFHIFLYLYAYPTTTMARFFLFILTKKIAICNKDDWHTKFSKIDQGKII